MHSKNHFAALLYSQYPWALKDYPDLYAFWKRMRRQLLLVPNLQIKYLKFCTCEIFGFASNFLQIHVLSYSTRDTCAMRFDSHIVLVCIFRMSWRPCSFGRPISICTSNLPGLSKASSIMSILFVIPISNMLFSESTPSILESSWVTMESLAAYITGKFTVPELSMPRR